jgi:hypothetical protein
LGIEGMEKETSPKNILLENLETKNKNKARAEVFRDVMMCRWVNEVSLGK